jgi:ATP-dependent Clp protease adaptor protein ClpS
MSDDLKTQKKTQLSKPKNYAVVLINDDFTPMDFVTKILTEIFNKSFEEAEQLMMEIHKSGKSAVAIYTYEIAESKALLVETAGRKFEFPLKAEVHEA